MFWLGLAAGVLVPLGLVPLCATVLLRRWLANEGFEDPDDDDDDDEFDWRAPSDPRGGQHATPAPMDELQTDAPKVGQLVTLHRETTVYTVAELRGCIASLIPVDGTGQQRFAQVKELRQLGTGDANTITIDGTTGTITFAQPTFTSCTDAKLETPIKKAIRLSTPEHPVGAIVPGPRLTDDPSRIDDEWIAEQRARLAEKQVAREQAEWDAVFGAERRATADTEEHWFVGQIVAVADDSGWIAGPYRIEEILCDLASLQRLSDGTCRAAELSQLRRVKSVGRMDAELDSLVDTIRRNP